MKKVSAIFLLLIYGFSTMGFTVRLHYCMNEFAGWSFWQSDRDDACGKCGMKENKDGCCKDEHKEIKLKTDHQKSNDQCGVHFSVPHVPALIYPGCNSSFYVASTTDATTLYSRPPPGNLLSRQILYCVFRL